MKQLKKKKENTGDNGKRRYPNRQDKKKRMFDEILELMKGIASYTKEQQQRIQDVKQRHEINISKQKMNASTGRKTTEYRYFGYA